MKNSLPLLILLPLIGCGVSQSSFRSEVRRVENDIADLRNFQAEQTTQIASLRADLREILGKLQEMDYSQKQKLGGDLALLKNDMSRLRRRVPPPAIVPVGLLEADEGLADRLPGDVGPIFSEALQKIRDGVFRDAVPLLQNLVAEGQEAEWLPNALFWVGVCFDGIGDNKSALQGYHDIVGRFPKHRRTPSALLRQAGVFVRLGDVATAKLTYNKLIAEFPNSEEASSAKAKLKSL